MVSSALLLWLDTFALGLLLDGAIHGIHIFLRVSCVPFLSPFSDQLAALIETLLANSYVGSS